MPTAVVPIAFFIVATGLCVLVLQLRWLVAIGLLISVAGTLAPKQLSASWLLLLLGASQLWRVPSASDLTFYVLLAGMHLTHVLGSLAAVLPLHGRIEVAAFVGPLKRFFGVQIIVQLVAISALHAFADGQGTIRGLSIVSASLLALVAWMFIRHVRTDSQDE